MSYLTLCRHLIAATITALFAGVTLADTISVVTSFPKELTAA